MPIFKNTFNNARLLEISRAGLALLIPLGGMVWVLSVPQRLGLLIFPEQILALLLGAAMGIVYLKSLEHCTSELNRKLSIILTIAAVASACYLAIRIPVLAEEAFFRPVEGFLVAVIVVPLVVEAVAKGLVAWAYARVMEI